MPSNIRLISRLDIKGPNLIKGIHLEGLRVLGDPNIFATKYYENNIDEILYIDSVASLYGRNNLSDILKKTVKNIFVPITAGGGLRSLDDVKNILRCGADKVAINSAAVKNPSLIKDVASVFGSQCMVLSIQAKKINKNKWEVMIESGREKTGIDVIDCSSGGIAGRPRFAANDDGSLLKSNLDRGLGFQVPYAHEIKKIAQLRQWLLEL